MNYLKLCSEKLDISAINDLVADDSCGAISLFVGTTRDNFEDKKVVSLEYEAYEPMAIKTMDKICDELRSKWPDVKHIAIYHRLGIVPVKEASVIIAVSSPHRQTSLESVQHAIDELKKSVPIWKKEQYENDSASWKANKECPQSKYFKKQKLNFDVCNIEINSIPKNLIQIGADESEMNRRIQCFVEKKREEIDLNNILDFTAVKSAQNEEETCARISGIVPKQKDSKGHLKVQRVKNEIGPQDKLNYTNTLDKLMDSSETDKIIIKSEPGEAGESLPHGIAERLQNAEHYLKMKSGVSKDIYQRLKTIEDKIIFLETLSPEYHHFIRSNVEPPKGVNKRTYSVQDLDSYIAKMKENIANRKDDV